MPALFMTRRHLSVSASMKCLNSSGVLDCGSAPCVMNAACIAGSLNTETTSRLSRVTSAAGVRAGASIPNQASDSKPLSPTSAAVGTSFIGGKRCLLETASALTLGVICDLALETVIQANGTSPATTANVAAPAPLYGT